MLEGGRVYGAIEMKKGQHNFRFSKEVAALLRETARRTGLSKTQVVEAALALYAKDRIPELTVQALKAFNRVMAENLSKDHPEKDST